MVMNMSTIMVTHSVEDYETWKPHFDGHDETRQEYGQLGYRLFRASEDPNEITVVLDWESEERAHEFLEESDIESVMAEGGVIGEPEIRFFEELESRLPETPMA